MNRGKSKKGTIVVVDLATPQLAKAIHDAGYQAMALILWHDRVTPSPWGVEAAGYDLQLRLKTTDPLEEIEKKVLEMASNIVGVIPTNEPSEEAACRLAAHFGLPHNDPEIAAIRWNKAKVKRLAQAAGLRVPRFQACHSVEDVKSFAKSLTFPIIIKTPAGSAGVNVFKCHNLEDLLAKHRIITTTPDDFGNQPRYSVGEEYISGLEYQVVTFSDGKNVHVTDIWPTEKIDTAYASNLFYNSWLMTPHDHSLQAVVEYAKRIIQSNHINYGPGHIELKVDENGPALIEIQARFGGGSLADIVRGFSNFDPFKATVEVFSKGHTAVPKRIKFSTHFAIAGCPSIWTCERGQIKGIKEVRHLPSHYASDPEWAYPRPVKPTTNLHDYPYAAVWLAGPDQKQLHKDMQRVHELLRIECV